MCDKGKKKEEKKMTEATIHKNRKATNKEAWEAYMEIKKEHKKLFDDLSKK